MNEILRSHLIIPTALRSNDFESFFSARKDSLWSMIEQAMGKPIQRDGLTEDIPTTEEEESEE
jgi:hypothetical protein